MSILVAVTFLATIAGCNLKPSSSQTLQINSDFNLTLPSTERLALSDLNPVLSLSPDGTQIVYVASHGDSQQLFLRQMGKLESRRVEGTEGARSPFFSPDGEWVGFFAAGKLKKVSISRGAQITLANAPGPRGASWGPDDTIIFAATTDSGLSQISASGGTPQDVTSLDPQKGELSHRWPEFLPGGNAVLYTAWQRDMNESQIVVQLVASGERKVLVQGATYGRYVPTGHLVYSLNGTLMAMPFDLNGLEVTGEPVPILKQVMQSSIGVAQFSYSHLGSLIYVPGRYSELDRTLVWVDRQGIVESLATPRRIYDDPKISPDGQRVAVQFKISTGNIWVYDIVRNSLTQITFEKLNNQPFWSPDGKRIAFGSTRAGGLQNLYWKSSDGNGSVERLTTSEYNQSLTSWSSDDKWLTFYQMHPTTGRDIWVLPLEGEREPYPFLKTPFQEAGAMFSPDGLWLAYVSDESGRYEVYVQPFPGPGGKWQISTEGGDEPVWARNGQELFYRNADQMMAVDITTNPSFSAGPPRRLFEGPYVGPRGKNFSNYDISPDGAHFLMLKTVDQQESAMSQVHVILNWFEELKRIVPIKD